MSFLLNDVKKFLDNLGTLGIIKIGALPPSPDAVGAIYEYGGRTPEHRFGIAGIGYEHPAFQLAFRGAPADFAGPRALAIIAWRALAAIQPGTLVIGSAIYLRIDAQQSPFQLEPVDENNRIRILCNYYAMKEP